MDHLHDAFRVHLFVSEDEVGEVEGAFIEIGIRGRKLPAHGSAPLAEVLFAGSASLTAIGHLIVALRRYFKRGIIVDALSRDGITIKSDRSIPRGMVIVRSQDGTIEVRDAEGIGQALIGAVTNAASRGGESRTESIMPSQSGEPST
ncbi:hypothetical protein ACFPC0_30530 [Streptomyces andamanensis]|uniref:Uncharacterized protein n=1 Tax=Streptomyces andamanensis TaxID=1565035 RepID=A0ABV8TMS0_9ACTN